MYLPAKSFLASRIGIPIEDEETGYEIIDAIVQWFAGVFSQLGSWLAEVLPKLGSWLAEALPKLRSWLAEAFTKLGSWLAEVLPKLGSFVAEEYHKSLAFILDVAHAVNEPLKQHPRWSLFISLFIFFGPWILLLPLFLTQAVLFVILSLLGFGATGVTDGSLAGSFQSTVYGAHTPAGSLFVILQSAGMHYNVGTASNWVLLVIRVIGGAVAAYVLFGIILAQ